MFQRFFYISSGLAAISEILINIGGVTKNRCVFGSKGQRCSQAGESLLALVVGCIQIGQQRKRNGITRMLLDGLLEQWDLVAACIRGLVLLFQPFIIGQQVSPNNIVLAVQIQRLTRLLGGVLVFSFPSIEVPQIGVGGITRVDR